MIREENYQKSLKIIRGFVDEILEGDIEKMQDFCFDDLRDSKYIGIIADPDMFLITQSIYIALWGDIYDLTFENMGTWNPQNTHPFRGDTMNGFGSLIGRENKRKGKKMGFRARYFGADRNEELWCKIEKFHRIYHYIGNFLVIPNRGTIRCGINGARATFYNEDYCEGMRDYFDWYLISIGEYQDTVLSDGVLSKFGRQLQMNQEYDPSFLKIAEWEERFFLKPYFKDGKPALLFKTPLEKRLKMTTVPEQRKDTGFYDDDEYLELLRDYLSKSIAAIEYRTRVIVEVLKAKLQIY